MTSKTSKILESLAHNLNTWQPDPSQNYMTGEYLGDLIEGFYAGLFSGQHVLMNTLPGFGKTVLVRKLGKAIYGDEGFGRIEFTEVTDEEEVRGYNNVEEQLRTGKKTKVVENTPFDERKKVYAFDELSRANPAAWTAALHALDHEKQNHCSIFAAVNWIMEDDRNQALLDRFAVTVHLPPATAIDVSAVAFAAGRSKLQANSDNLLVPCYYPTAEEVKAVREASLSDESLGVVVRFVQEIFDYVRSRNQILKAERKDSFDMLINPRLVTQWVTIIGRLSIAYSGSCEFTQIPRGARRIIRYLFPAMTANKAIMWQSLIYEYTVGDAFDIMLDRYVSEMKEIAERIAGTVSTIDKSRVIQELFDVARKANKDLLSTFGQSDRLKEAKQKLNRLVDDTRKL